jgi:N-acetylated-alpha-linked acidic dipeptidase
MTTGYKAFFFLLTITFLGLPKTVFSQKITGFLEENAQKQTGFEEELGQLLSSEKFRNHLWELTNEPHVAGTQGSERVIEYIANSMESAGLEVELHPYDVLLAEEGEVMIRIEGDDPIELKTREKTYEEDPWSAHPELTHGWNAYSASGEITAEVVYVNYGRLEDFEKLDSMGIDLSGKIAFARYGGNFRGFKAKYAEEAGAAGLIIFTDPADSGFKRGEIYPNGRFNDESAIQRGSLLTLEYYGDPLTPFEAALPLDHPDTPERLEIEDTDLPRIPVTPIGYGAAEKILERMEGSDVPEDWQGGFDFPYRIQGGSGLNVTLRVDQPLEIKRINNITGKIEGSEFPDEWIIVGCHHDAWAFGSADPNSGTAMMLTLIDALSEKLDEGWQPRRTIVFAHWDAEEFGLIGASEWVEHHLEELMDKTVFYLNADMSVTGPNFRASASPVLHSAIMEAATAVMHPDTQLTLFEYWMRGSERDEPHIGNLGSGSDFVPFVHRAGIPSAQVSMSGSVPVYHSAYDNLYFYENFIDSNFVYGPALAEYYGVLVTRFANADILPFDPLRLAAALDQNRDEIEKRVPKNIFEDSNIESLTELLGEQAGFYNSILNNLASFGESETENFTDINQTLLRLERNLILEEGLEFRPWLRNTFISPDPFRGYAAWVFPIYRYSIERDLLDDVLHMHQVHQLHTDILMRLISDTGTLIELMR